MKTSGSTIAQERASEVAYMSSDVVNILSNVTKKEALEKKAFEALDRRLEQKHVMCRRCKGDGDKQNGETCSSCQGQGFVVEDADMRAIELVLAPKFPKTSVNLSADIEGMSVEDLMKAIDAV